MSENIKIILADDHPVVRSGIRSLISQYENVEILAEASNGAEALDLVEKLEPDILITDISMPIMTGLDVASAITEKKLLSKVIILSMHNEPEYILKAFNSGIMGYLLKDSDQFELFDAISSVRAGKKYVAKKVSRVIANNMLKGSKGQMSQEELTTRETEILRLVVDGLRNKEIASELGISVRTVDTHRTNIMRKLGVNNAAELVRKSISDKLV